MKHQRNIKRIAIIAFVLSILGFIVDLNELDPNKVQNIKDITTMSVILFVIGLLLYGLRIISVRLYGYIK